MEPEIKLVSDLAFKIFLSVATAGVAGAWLIHDLRLLVRLGGKGSSDALVRDQRFGYAIGIVIGIIGVVGTLHFVLAG